VIVKEESLQELRTWLAGKAGSIGLLAVKMASAIDPAREKFPAVFVHEGDDKVVKHSSTKTGFPVIRNAEIIFEVWADRTQVDIKEIYGLMRTEVFSCQFSNRVELREVRAFGPFSSSNPNILVMQLITGITYSDAGPLSRQS